jgi:hypothetical protein
VSVIVGVNWIVSVMIIIHCSWQSNWNPSNIWASLMYFVKDIVTT